MFTKYLELETLHKLMNSLLSSQMISEESRVELLNGIHAGFVAQLPTMGNPRQKIFGDLATMNTVAFLETYEVPLRLWLQNAVYRLRSGARPEHTYFEQVLQEVTAASQVLVSQAQGNPRDPAALDSLEHIVHEDDMLSFGWLQEAIVVGRSVARLTVPRYENGLLISGRHFYGTGWLIGSQHLITNHHVINARSEGEPNASKTDLVTQVMSMHIQFDYNQLDAAVTSARATKLCAWCPRDADPALDYAVVELSEPSMRPPLVLAPRALSALVDGKLPVNVIQHPGGQPKMIGIRNNQVHELGEWELSYFTDTEGGSSGSPVCNDEWKVVALHRRWNRFINKNVMFQGKSTAWDNSGTRIDRIINDLVQSHSELWDEIGAVVH